MKMKCYQHDDKQAELIGASANAALACDVRPK